MSLDNTILEKAKSSGFVDPLTGHPPTDETTLSALLSIFHQQRRIDWSKVKMRMPQNPTIKIDETADQVINQDGCLSAEYPLFWESHEQFDAYGGMRPDFIYISGDGKTVALIENKIGASPTHKGDSYGGQFGRYTKYLGECVLPRRYLILITMGTYIERKPPWYTGELLAAAAKWNSDRKVEYRIIIWEDILKAFAKK